MPPEKHPAVEKYLSALKAEFVARPGAAGAEALADAREFLDSEWASLRRQAYFYSDDALYRHFVRKLGDPRALAAEYAGDETSPFVADPAAANAAAPGAKRPRRRILHYALLLTSCVLLASAAALLRNATDGGSTGASVAAAATTSRLQGIHWAERVASFVVGDQDVVRATRPEAVLGPPDCQDTVRQSDRVACLGVGGELVVEFVKRRLTDGPGVDLLVDELGLPEPVFVAVSEDGVAWVDVGATTGNTVPIDLADSGATGRAYRFVRVRDARSSKLYGATSPGADVDAIGAVHSIPAP